MVRSNKRTNREQVSFRNYRKKVLQPFRWWLYIHLTSCFGFFAVLILKLVEIYTLLICIMTHGSLSLMIQVRRSRDTLFISYYYFRYCTSRGGIPCKVSYTTVFASEWFWVCSQRKNLRGGGLGGIGRQRSNCEVICILYIIYYCICSGIISLFY